MTSSAAPSRSLTVRSILVCLGLVFGGALGFAVGKLMKSGVIDVSSMSWSDEAAAVIAVALMALGLIIGIVSLNRRAAGRMMDPEGERPATAGQASFYRQQGLVLFLAGAMMAAPVVAVVLFDPLPFPIASAVMLAIVAAFLAQTAYNLLVWRRADELMRQTISQTGAVCFWVLQGLLFLWAAAEKLNIAPALSAWDMMTLMMGFYLIVSSAMSMRRGLT